MSDIIQPFPNGQNRQAKLTVPQRQKWAKDNGLPKGLLLIYESELATINGALRNTNAVNQDCRRRLELLTGGKTLDDACSAIIRTQQQVTALKQQLESAREFGRSQEQLAARLLSDKCALEQKIAEGRP